MAGAGEVWAFVATCPPGIQSDAPIILELAMPVRDVISIRVEIPIGPSGAMGWALGAAGAQVIPVPPTQFVVTDRNTFIYELPQQIDSGAWEAQMYNTGQYEHSIYVYFTVQLPDADDTRPTTVILPAEALGSSAGNVALSAVAPAPSPLQIAS
jgi:hypothetical protein